MAAAGFFVGPFCFTVTYSASFGRRTVDPFESAIDICTGVAMALLATKIHENPWRFPSRTELRKIQ